MILITQNVINTDTVLAAVASTQAGAVVLFLGTTREFTQGKQTVLLEYECYAAMAEKKLQELLTAAAARWSLVGCAIVHRVGPVPLGETSVAIAVSATHRAEAFAAGQWLIDTLKQEVPIWKKEQWADGSSEWVHPGIQPNGVRS